MRPIPEMAVTFVAAHEGLRLTAYRDLGGVWTVGYGHAGPQVAEGLTISEAEARRRLAEDLAVAARRLQARIGPVVWDLTEAQYSALLSLVFNVGADPSWTIWKRLRARQFDQAPVELMKFVNAGGRKVQGLVNRRAEECKLWAVGEPGSTDDAPPSGVTRVMATPPTPGDPTPPARSATVLTAAAGAAATVPVAVKAVSDAIAPYREASPLVGQAAAWLATLAAAAAALVVVLTWLKAKAARS